MPDDFPLGRVHVPDERDANFPMRMLIAPQIEILPQFQTKMWRAQPLRLNQGNLGACVGFTGANWLGSLPLYNRVTDKTGFDLYAECKKIDGIPNEEGTYDRALAKVLVAQGRIERYLWAQTIDELRTWVQRVGPVMVGTHWYSDMFTPSRPAYELRPTGSIVGGHEWLIRGFQVRSRTPFYRMRNSWGASWADNGEAWITEEAVKFLVFGGSGDALGAVEKRP